MVGAVLHQEILLGSRRTRQSVFRWLYAGWLVVQVIGIYLMTSMSLIVTRSEADKTFLVASSFTHSFLNQQFILLILATPVFTAGAVTDEKTRGTLQYLLTTELTAWDIILGKWLARAYQVAVLFLTGLPLFCFLGVFGGLRLGSLFGWAAVSILTVLALGAASLLASVWSKQTWNAVLGLFLFATVAIVVDWSLGSWFLSPVLRPLNPFYVLEPGWTGESLASMGGRLLLSALVWGSVTVVCLTLAAWRLRPTYLRQLQQQGRPKKERWWRARRPNIGADPIRWKERQVEGLAPLPVLRGIPSWVGVLTVFLVTVISSLVILWSHRPADFTFEEFAHLTRTGQFANLGIRFHNFEPADDFFMALACLTMFLASLVVGIRCSGAISGEREKQTWEALLLTPLATRMLVRGKLQGIMRAGYPYLRAYAVPAVLLSFLGGVTAVIWTIIALPVTWLAMYFVGAAGIWCSVRSKSSWRSLLGTLGFGYVGGFLFSVFTTPAILIVSAFVYIFLMMVDAIAGTSATRVMGFGQFHQVFFLSACIVLAGGFFGAAKFFLSLAEKRVADLERTRHWRNEPYRQASLGRSRAARSKSYR